MSSQIQELIDKIKSDGIETAKNQAGEIEQQAQKQADDIISKAKQQAEAIILQAREDVKKMEESAQKSLKQSARDMLLSLRQEVERTLHRLIIREVHHSLSNEHLTSILTEVIHKTVDASVQNQGLEVTVSHKDLKSLEDGFIAKLQKEIKKGIKFHSSDDLEGGFTISYDEGRSSYEFSDESLANYLATFLNEQVSKILKESV